MEGLRILSIGAEIRATILAILHLGVAAAVTIHTLMSKRDVPSAIGWIGMAWLAPVFGALLYVGFGINRVKRRAHRLMGTERSAEIQKLDASLSSEPFQRLKSAVGRITGKNIIHAKVEAVLQCGDEAYPQMLAAIERAQSRVSLATYIFRTDEVGQQFITALSDARCRGVDVRVLIDGFGGGFLFSGAYWRLRRAGVPVARFLHSMVPWKMSMLDLRLHKKVLIIDGHTVFVGGLNIASENLVNQLPKWPIRDIHFRLTGGIVGQVEQDFCDDWFFTTGAFSEDLNPAPTIFNDGLTLGRAIASGPDQEFDQLVLVLLSAINLAQHSIRIATPYFLPDEQLITALKLAALRGVEVHIVLPAVNNHRLVAWAARAHVRPLLETGCFLWRAPPPFDHSKLMTIDDQWSLIGSANWDARSLRLNFELTIELYDTDLACQIAGIIDQKRGTSITLGEIDKRRFIVKLRDAAARLFAPYL